MNRPTGPGAWVAALAATVVLAGLGLSAALSQSEIFVPTPRGAGETLDTSPDAPAPGAETVTTRRGDQLRGRVLGIGADGRLRLTGPQFEGEVKVMVSELDQVAMGPSDKSTGRDTLVIANDDRIVGEVTSITSEAVTITSDAAGPIKVARGVVSAVTFGKGAFALVESSFDRGQMEPFKPTRGNWQVQDGGLVCQNSGSNYLVAAPVDQDGPVTMEVAFEPMQGNPSSGTLVLFADNTSSTFGNNSVYVMFYSSEYYVGYSQNGSTNSVINRSLGNSLRGNTVLRMAFDPESKKCKLWMNGNLLGEYDVPQGPRTGKYVMVGSQYSAKIKRVQVTGGISAPSEAGSGQGRDDSDTVQFANKDRISTQSVTLAGGVVTVQTTYGELKSPVDKLSYIVFRKTGQERPRRLKGDVLVETHNSRFTLQLQALSETALTGECDYLGKIAIKRPVIKSVKFNIYPQ